MKFLWARLVEWTARCGGGLARQLEAQRRANAALLDGGLRAARREEDLRARIAQLEHDLDAANELNGTPCLSASEIERLAILAEESAEVVRICGKILRHGWESCSPYDDRSRPNRVLLERELGGLRGAIDLMLTRGDVRAADIASWRKRKRAGLRQWTHRQHWPVDAAGCDGGGNDAA